MKIKRFVAPDMRTALRMVRAEHGPDAVILSNRRTEEGVEIVAASNYDENAVQRALLEAQRTAEAQAAAARPNPFLAGLPPPPEPVAPPQAPAPVRMTPDFAAAMAAALSTPTAQAAAVARHDDAHDAPAPAQAASATPAPGAGIASLPAAQAVRAEEATPALAAVPSPPAPANDAQLVAMREELAQMRQMIEREMHRLTDERLRGSPIRLQAMELMEDYGFDAGITRDIVLQLPPDTPEHRGRGLMLGLISRQLPVCPLDPLEQGGVIALVGPTGAGKTTTIAKLAARFVAQHGPRDIALVTTDTARIGGREQLHGYGRQLGIAVHEADSDAALIQLLQKLEDYRLVLVDTAGLGQRDRALASQLNWLRAARNVSTLLVLPANSHYADLDEVVRRFGPARPQGVVLTKLDETGRLGSALSVVVDHQLPLTWITDGQRVPEDLHRANAASLVLHLEDLRRAADKPNIPEHDHAVA
ncbi:flagellar biosynthesis protein FlhF [Pseudoxanthomonas broegbernensis]|uniref:Flagellar biosynthesis protein FlhF n=1 Tax=Pseudoxanthomonas broegbernensis TaxID=83619 RepID=A0A7V8GL90_9GAMM|nr:flagellar biosynthesis protein FlhF [Pseudoxanthomonas broegbernensis]KAF1685620.1 flagellar biosynthesis protein FlhF [Pseudoxanthomonas broegbernensis]MBB6065995.1 flagellar biosynthesis protein FlhF [Pseudoxanthomonas broegbernensis]